MESIKGLKKVFTEGLGKSNIFFSMVWGASLLAYLDWIFIRLPIISSFAEYMLPLIFIVTFFILAKYLFRLYTINDLAFYFVCTIVFIACYGLGPQANAHYIKDYFPTFFWPVALYFFVGKGLRDNNIFRVFYWASIIYLLFFFISHFITNDISETFLEENEAQGQAYSLVPHVLIVLWYTLKKFDILSLIFSIFGFLMLISFGCRGAMLCILVFAVLYILLCTDFSKNKLWLVVILVAGVFLYANLTKIAIALQYLGGDIGVSTRIVDIFIDGEIADGTGRDTIQDALLSSIGDRFWGYGICGDKVLTGLYAHNVYLEFLISFGIFIGGALCIALTVLLVKGFLSCPSRTNKGFYLVMLCCGFVHLLVSDTFLNQPHFFMLIGYASLMIYNKKHNVVILQEEDLT